MPISNFEGSGSNLQWQLVLMFQEVELHSFVPGIPYIMQAILKRIVCSFWKQFIAVRFVAIGANVSRGRTALIFVLGFLTLCKQFG